MNESKELFLPDTTVKLGTLRKVLNDTYGLDIIKLEMANKDILKKQDGGTLISTRRFTDYDFDKLMESGLFRAYRSVVLLNIYPTNGSKLVGKFNSDKEYIYISGKKDLSNPLVKWLSENSYVTSDEYRSLADGGGVGGTFDSSSTGEVIGGTFGSSKSGVMIGGTMASSMYAKGSTLRASKSPLLEFAKFEDNWVINLVKLNPNRNQQGLLYKGGNKYAVVRNSDKGKQELFEFKTLEEAEDKFDKLVTQSTTYSPISNKGKIEGNYADGGGVGNEFYVGQSIMLDDKLPHFRRLTKDIQRLVRPYYNVELVIEEIINDKPYNYAKAFVRSNGEKVPFEIKLNEKYIQKYANGGGIGGTSDSAEMDAPTLGGTMSSSMFEGDTYSNRFENKLWNEIANGTPHSFKKGGKVGDCGCKEKYDEGGNAECGCWHYDIGGL